MRIGRATVLAMAGVALALGGLNGCSSDPAPDGAVSPAASVAPDRPAGGSATPAASPWQPGDVNQTEPSGTQTTKAPVAPGKPANFGEGISVSLRASRPVTIKAQTPGENSGPGRQYVLTFVNAGERPISLTSTLVAAFLGDGTPLLQTVGPETKPATGSLNAGQKRSGAYAFLVDRADQDDVILTVTYATDQPAVRLRTS